MMRTFETEIIRKGGYTSGFDYLRIILAALVVFWHAFVCTGSLIPEAFLISSAFKIMVYLILPMFFGLSGFLVTASLLRTNKLWPFLVLRGIRLGPALLFEIFLSAILLGPVLTTISLPEYFSSHLFQTYFLNVFGWPHYLLPGVFESNPTPRVNAALWTVPYEAECYIALAILFVVRLTRAPRIFLAVLGVLIVGFSVLAIGGHDVLDTGLPRGTLTGRQLVICFLVGSALYLNRHIVPYNRALIWAAAALSICLIRFHSLQYLALIPIVYLTACLGLTTPRKAPLIFTGDYSYGVYLYGGPILQTVVILTGSRNPIAVFFIALPLVGAFAMLSWHLVKSPALKMKKHFIKRRSVPKDQMISPDKTNELVATNPSSLPA